MKTIATVLSISLFASACNLSAQDLVPRTEAVKIASLVNFNLGQLADTPIPTDADTKRPFGMRAERRGVLVVPEVRLSAATFANLGEEVRPIGQLCLAGLVPARNAEPVPREQLKMITVEYEGRDVTFPLCVLGARKGRGDKPELLVYGKSKEPLLVLPLTRSDQPGKGPLEFDAVRDGDSARVTLFLAGKYQAEVRVTAPAE